MATKPNKMPAKSATPKASAPQKQNTQPKPGFAKAWAESDFSKKQTSPSDSRPPASGNIQRSSSGDDVVGRLRPLADFVFQERQRAEGLKTKSTSNQQFAADRIANQQFNRIQDTQREAVSGAERAMSLQDIYAQNNFNRQMKAAENKTFSVSSANPQQLAQQQQMRLQREAMDRQEHQAVADRNWRSGQAEKDRAARAAELAAAKQSSESASVNQKRMMLLQLAGRSL